MEGATHFIMCWKINSKVYGQSEIFPIRYPMYFAGIHTIIYIKLKNTFKY